MEILLLVIDLKENFYEKKFQKRSVICFFIIMVMMLSCVLRVAIIVNGEYAQMSGQQSAYKIDVGRIRGTIYDKNMVPLTNNDTRLIAAVSPTERSAVAVRSLVKGQELQDVLEKLSKGLPAVCAVEREIDCDSIAFTKQFIHNSKDSLAQHTIGYVGSDGHGVSGLEAAYDSLLYSDDFVSAVFTKNGKGVIMDGISPQFENNMSSLTNGVVTTLDINIQAITEKAMEGFVSGAAIVANANTGEIAAICSRPNFDANNISEYLNADNSPLLNKALQCFSVGSVFKPCVAAAAMESGNEGFIFECTGNTQIIDRKFNCHKLDGHGLMNLKGALANSCNCYFYNFAIDTGSEVIYKMASSLSFGNDLYLCDNLYAKGGNLTKKESLSNIAMLANLSIGQGDLILSPVSMLTLYCAIASNGTYYVPSIVSKTIKGGEISEYKKEKPTRVMSEQTAKILREYLVDVITVGTGKGAQPKNCSAAGKTATAQTGRYLEDSTEITNSWFCGFFPVENPKYVVVVMAEGKSEATTTQAFAQIVDGIYELEN